MVLNSVVNLPKALPFLARHSTIHAFFDNDDAGRKATAELIRLCPRSEVVDQSCFYSGHKDVNDYLIAHIKDHAKKLAAQKNASKTKTVQSVRNNPQPLKAKTAAVEPQRRKGVKV
ncbi:toprim domain-containing protein [Alistipes communis]|uniref:toprim domain-containing protein n=1 Tax=uncultured Alistipes sp. TaxID=538949 RepID=UPI0031BB6BA8